MKSANFAEKIGRRLGRNKEWQMCESVSAKAIKATSECAIM